MSEPSGGQERLEAMAWQEARRASLMKFWIANLPNQAPQLQLLLDLGDGQHAVLSLSGADLALVREVVRSNERAVSH